MGKGAFIAWLGAAALYISCLAVAHPAPRSDTDFRAPTCDEFKDRLAHMRSRIGIIVPDAEYISNRSNDDGSMAWAISNYLDLDANVKCRDSVFVSMEIQPTDFIDVVVQRESSVIEAAIAAWTGWTKRRAVSLVNGLSAGVTDDMHTGRIYGAGTGSISYNLPGGAVVHLSNDGYGLHLILNSADEEQHMQGTNARLDPSMRLQRPAPGMQ